MEKNIIKSLCVWAPNHFLNYVFWKHTGLLIRGPLVNSIDNESSMSRVEFARLVNSSIDFESCLNSIEIQKANRKWRKIKKKYPTNHLLADWLNFQIYHGMLNAPNSRS